MRILVTGGTGFLGRRLVAELAPRHALRLLVRRTASRTGFPDGVELVTGDVTDLLSLRDAAQGCEAILHAAALVKILAPPKAFENVNLDAFQFVVAAAEMAEIERIVYVSSFIALGPTEHGPGGVLDESAPPVTDPSRWINDYQRTKATADRIARLEIAEGSALQVVYPGVIYGPGEMTEGNIVVRHVLDLLHRRLPALIGRPERRWSYAYVDDVARGIAAVVERGAPGGRWVLGGPNVTLAEFYATVERLSGVRVPRRRMPDALATAVGAVQKAWARRTGGTPQLTPDLVEVYRHDWAYSSARAEAELGYRCRPLEEGLAATLAWLEESGQWVR